MKERGIVRAEEEGRALSMLHGLLTGADFLLRRRSKQ